MHVVGSKNSIPEHDFWHSQVQVAKFQLKLPGQGKDYWQTQLPVRASKMRLASHCFTLNLQALVVRSTSLPSGHSNSQVQVANFQLKLAGQGKDYWQTQLPVRASKMRLASHCFTVNLQVQVVVSTSLPKGQVNVAGHTHPVPKALSLKFPGQVKVAQSELPKLLLLSLWRTL